MIEVISIAATHRCLSEKAGFAGKNINLPSA